MTERAFTVAIDGPAAAGKGTIAKAVAARFGFAHLDSGLLYRAIGYAHLGGAEPVAAAEALTPADLDESVLRTAEVAKAASVVAVIPEVRAALLAFQRRVARQPGGAVLDGRDIGTVICPSAEVKLFVTASDTVRAERRFLELAAQDASVTRAAVLADVRARDARDAERTTAPMRAAEDALLLDTSEMSVEAAVASAISAVEQKLNPPSQGGA
jgi:cytidylate kinase